MNKVKLLLVIAFLMVLAAGLFVGMALDRHLHPPTVAQSPRSLERLHLTHEQQEKMKAIWSEVGRLRDQRFQARHQLFQERDRQISDLLTAEQKQRYREIQDRYRTQVETLENNLQQAVHDAERQTREMLTPEQRPIWDDIRSHQGPPPRSGSSRRRSRGATAPTTQP